MSDRGFTGTQVLLAFVAGAAAGAIAALLTAPKSGRETREDLKAFGKSLSETATRVPTAVRQAGGAAVDAFKETINA